jgi:hypothetical protein
MRIVTYLIEYLGDFEFIFETIFDYELGDQISSFDAKNRHRKFHAWAPLRRRLLPCGIRNYLELAHGLSQAEST